MADTRADVAVAKATWVNVYTASGVAVGTAVVVTNKGGSNCYLVIKATTPSTVGSGFPLFAGPVSNTVSVSAGETGLWAYAPDGDTKLLVQD